MTIDLGYLGSLRLLWLDPLDLGEGDVKVGAVLLVAPRNLPQLLLALFEQVLVQEGAATEVLILFSTLYKMNKKNSRHEKDQDAHAWSSARS